MSQKKCKGIFTSKLDDFEKSRNVDCLIRIVVISAKKPIILISTDRTLTAGQIIELYGSRFSIEIAIRELKQHFGMGDYQSYVTIAFHRFVHLCCVLYFQINIDRKSILVEYEESLCF